MGAAARESCRDRAGHQPGTSDRVARSSWRLNTSFSQRVDGRAQSRAATLDACVRRLAQRSQDAARCGAPLVQSILCGGDESVIRARVGGRRTSPALQILRMHRHKHGSELWAAGADDLVGLEPAVEFYSLSCRKSLSQSVCKPPNGNLGGVASLGPCILCTLSYPRFEGCTCIFSVCGLPSFLCDLKGL